MTFYSPKRLTAAAAAFLTLAISPHYAHLRAQQPAAATALPAGIERVTSVEGITEYRMPNGLRVLLFPDQSKQKITVNVTYLVGSRHENYGETGMAHLLEHMLFKGSTKHTNVPQELTEHGSDANGTTWTDRTNYFETIRATDSDLRWALDLESDRMVHSFIAKKDLDSEFTVVRNEYESGENSPQRILHKHLLSVAYDWHNYGKDTIGERSDIENVPIERLQAFYRMYYQPDNAVLMVTGKFDEPKTLALVNEYFGPIPKPARTLPKIYTVEPTQDGERSVTVRRVGDVQLVEVVHHISPGAHPDYAAIEVLSLVLGDTPSGRLYKTLVESKKAVNVWAYSDAMYDPGILDTAAQVSKDGSLEDARAVLLQTVENVVKNPPTKEEVDRARAKLLKQITLELAASEEIGLDLSEYLAQGDWRLFFLTRDRIRQVTPEDVKRVATTYLKVSNRTVGLFIPTPVPDRSTIPNHPDVAAMLKDYRGDQLLAAGEAFEPTPANIESRTKRSTTPNGVKLALLTRKTRGATVEAQLTLHIGNEKDLMNRGAAGSVAGEMLMRGTTKRTRQQIQDELDKLEANVSVGGGSESVFASIETKRDHLPAVIQLVGEILRQPSFPRDEFDQIKQETIANIEAQRQQPNAVASRALSRHLDPYGSGHPRHILTFDEQTAQYKALTLDDVKKFYADFYGADRAELAVVGDFDADETTRLVNQALAGWKNRLPFMRIVSINKDAPAIDETLETPDKPNAYFTASLPLAIRQDDPDYPAVVIGNYLFGGGFLSSRFPARVRGKEGLSYGAGSAFGADWFDKTGRFTAYAISAPENIKPVESGFREELARVLKDGFTAEEVEKAKEGWLQEREIDRSTDDELAATLRNYLFQGRTYAWDADLDNKVRALTPNDILAALRRHIDPAKISIVKAGDVEKPVRR
jgi:zinc protease